MSIYTCSLKVKMIQLCVSHIKWLLSLIVGVFPAIVQSFHVYNYNFTILFIHILDEACK